MTNVTETDKVLAGMLTENTGRHMLDSGGAYGRNWERNKGKLAEDFLNAPEATLQVWREDDWYININLFHFLRERLEYDAALNEMLDEFIEENPEDNWVQIAEGFAEYYSEKSGEETDTITVNSYNHENLLDQVIQYVQVSGDSGDPCYPDFIILQVHGGCDVRGGYTRPIVFLSTGESGLLDDSDAGISCAGMPVSPDPVLPGFDKPEVQYHSWSFYGSDMVDESGASVDEDLGFTYDEDNEQLLCHCGAKLEAG